MKPCPIALPLAAVTWPPLRHGSGKPGPISPSTTGSCGGGR